MPELPEVEVCRRGLAPELEGMQIKGVVIRAPRLRVLIPPELDCQRVGVEGCLIIHLGMSGNLRFVPHDLAPAKHDHFELVLADQILRFADPRRFGVVVWQPGPPEDAELHPLLASQGIEPLSEAFTVDWLFAANSRRSGPIRCGRPTGSVGRVVACWSRRSGKPCRMRLRRAATVFAIMSTATAGRAASRFRRGFTIAPVSPVCVVAGW